LLFASPPSLVMQLMVLPPASMLPCLAMRRTGSSALAVEVAKTSAVVAAHHEMFRNILGRPQLRMRWSVVEPVSF
jgi:hypothetical protein